MRGTKTDWAFFVVGWLVAFALITQPFVTAAVEEEKKLRETDWSKRIAADFRAQGVPAETEFVCPDGSRVDILLPEYAVEVDWAHGGKFKEAIGQAILYGVLTNREPMVILLKSKTDDPLEYLRCAVACAKAGIRLEVRSVD